MSVNTRTAFTFYSFDIWKKTLGRKMIVKKQLFFKVEGRINADRYENMNVSKH